VEEVKMVAIAILAYFFLSPHFCFCQTVDVKPLKVQHLCGFSSDGPSYEMVLTSDDRHLAARVVKIDHGIFDFKAVPVGHYYLNMRLVDDPQEVSNSRPIHITVMSEETTCRRPLKVEIPPGVDAPLGVSYLKVRAKK
jgi:hypothetical protein